MPLAPLRWRASTIARGDGGAVDGVEQQLEAGAERGAGVSGRERLEQRELALGEAGGGALGGGWRQRAALARLAEQVGGDGVGAVHRQRRAQRLDRLVEAPLFEVAAAEARPGAVVLRRPLDDGGVDADGLVAEVGGFHQFEGTPFEGGEVGRFSHGIARTKKKAREFLARGLFG